MNRHEVEFHPAATLELQEAREWYLGRNEPAAERFSLQVARIIDEIAAGPHRWPEYLCGTRHHLVRGFPYIIVYRQVEDRVQIIAAAHAKRAPGYWQDRLSR